MVLPDKIWHSPTVDNGQLLDYLKQEKFKYAVYKLVNWHSISY